MLVKYISLLGHKDHGKSTLLGSLLMQTGAATQVRINEAKMYSDRMHKPFEPAFILDSFAEEREQEMTYDTTRAEIKYKDLAFALIDVPGHEELIKNMISGASYGEIAILLVSAKKEEGIKDQTKRHLFISRMLGMDRLIVAVNKMDSVEYNEKRFNEIKDGLIKFIERIGFPKKNVQFVPISAYNGENLVKKSANMKWYKEDTLIDALYNNANVKEKAKKGALRIVMQGVIDANSNIVGGKIISGKLTKGEEVVILPDSKNVIVKEIIVKGKKVKSASNDDNVAIKLDKKIDLEIRGTIVSELENRPQVTNSIKARIFVTGDIGNKLQIKFNGLDVKCEGIKIINTIDTTTGEESKTEKPQFLNAIDAEIKLSKELPIESYEITKELGRFVLYNNGEFSGIGIIN